MSSLQFRSSSSLYHSDTTDTGSDTCPRSVRHKSVAAKADRDNQKVSQDSQDTTHPLGISTVESLSSSSSSDSTSEVEQDDELADRDQCQLLDEDDTDAQFCSGSAC